MAGDLDPVAEPRPRVDDLDRMRVRPGAGDGRVGVRVGDDGPEPLVAQPADLPRVPFVVGQLDAEPALAEPASRPRSGADVESMSMAMRTRETRSLPPIMLLPHGGRAFTPARGPRRRRSRRALALDGHQLARAPTVGDDRRGAGYVIELGWGPPVLHPRPLGLVAELARTAARVARDHRVITFDLPGFGASELPRERSRPPATGASVEALPRRASAIASAAARQLDGRLHRHRARDPLPSASSGSCSSAPWACRSSTCRTSARRGLGRSGTAPPPTAAAGLALGRPRAPGCVRAIFGIVADALIGCPAARRPRGPRPRQAGDRSPPSTRH